VPQAEVLKKAQAARERRGAEYIEDVDVREVIGQLGPGATAG
jgi:hypothetical protein